MFPINFPTLDTQRLRLRALDADDADAVFGIFSHPEVMRYWSTAAMTDIAAAQELIGRASAAFAERAAIRWAIVPREGGQVLGTCSLFAFSAQNRRAELGYVLGRTHWGHGYIHEALVAVVDYAFGVLDLHRLETDIDPRNEASVRTAARLGFVREGHLRERWIVGDEISDSLIMGLLRSAWQGAGENR